MATSSTQKQSKDFGEYQSDQVHDYQVGSHELEDEQAAELDDIAEVDTGECQSDQVRQVRAGMH
jgi:hypothetical protein